MKTKNKFLLGLGCLLSIAIAFAACEAKEPAASSPYPVYDSGAWADPLGYADIYWLDNNRVIFRSVQNNDKKRISIGPFNISIWEIGKGVSLYAKNVATVQGLLGRFCYNSDGMIFYPLAEKDAQGNEQYKYGEFGKEKLFTRPKNAKTILEAMNCRILDVDTMMKERKGRAIIPLLDRHGYLELGPTGIGSSENNPITFHRSDGKVIELPLHRREVDSVAYYPFKDAYFIYGEYYDEKSKGVTNVWPRSAIRYVWWLYPDGRVEAVKFPDGPWVKEVKPGSGYVTYNTKLYPTRQGYFLAVGEAKSTAGVGAYLLRDGKLTKLIGGYFREPAISPNGCKVAFVHYPYADATIADDPALIRLKAVDLCPN